MWGLGGLFKVTADTGGPSLTLRPWTHEWTFLGLM